MLPQDLRIVMDAVLAEQYGTSVRVVDATPVGGGCIHNACRLRLARHRDVFLKYNAVGEYANFSAEGRGLRTLAEAEAIAIAQPIRHGKSEGHAFLLLEYIASAPRKRGFWTEFGQQLAGLHRHTQVQYGFVQDNFIGRLAQKNDWRDNWTDFFVEMRLEPQLVLAEQNGYADAELRRSFARLYHRLPDLVPQEPASLLHGDLWGGNFMVGAAGEPVIIDPAVYYGHREMEIAFTQLFGGFDREFYAAYQAAYPLASGWESRTDLMNLYPLAVHLNLFGRSYLPEIRRTLGKYA
ncbi:MAG: fructosamine kinase family protein [Bacteroidota bacterium]